MNQNIQKPISITWYEACTTTNKENELNDAIKYSMP